MFSVVVGYFLSTILISIEGGLIIDHHSHLSYRITHFIITIDPILPGNDNSISVTYANIIRFEKIGMIIK
jgi:hypothetical protein